MYGQLRFMLYEMSTTGTWLENTHYYMEPGDFIKETKKDAAYLSKVFQYSFERSETKTTERRAHNAVEFYNYFVYGISPQLIDGNGDAINY